MKCYVVLPSLKISGGIREALRLAEDLNRSERNAEIITMWSSAHSMPTSIKVVALSRFRTNLSCAIFQLPLLMVQFWRLLLRIKQQYNYNFSHFIFTHYATLPLSFLVPRSTRFFFVQDLEWRFIKNKLLMNFIQVFVLWVYRRGNIISANAYLTSALADLKLTVSIEAPIWADAAFLHESDSARDVDFVMVLRKGAHKRLDLYLSFIEQARVSGRYRMAVITPEDDIADSVRELVSIVLRRPSLREMRTLYAQSKCFVHLSDHEGFGLPPLEAMGSGCVPLCRDSGGVRAFMKNNILQCNLIPLSINVDVILRQGQSLIDDLSLLRSLSEASRQIFINGVFSANDRGARLSSVFS